MVIVNGSSIQSGIGIRQLLSLIFFVLEKDSRYFRGEWNHISVVSKMEESGSLEAIKSNTEFNVDLQTTQKPNTITYRLNTHLNIQKMKFFLVQGFPTLIVICKKG